MSLVIKDGLNCLQMSRIRVCFALIITINMTELVLDSNEIWKWAKFHSWSW